MKVVDTADGLTAERDDHVSLAEVALLEGVGQPLEVAVGEACEEVDAAQKLGRGGHEA